MYSGFISKTHTVSILGIHQRFDMAAYHMIEQYLPKQAFPELKDILHFEGYNGPDGLKVKSRGSHEPSHLYDPISDTGAVPMHIEHHYNAMVEKLSRGDLVRAAFEASWMAHYIGDGMTPAHHFPLEEKVAQAAARATDGLKNGDVSKFSSFLKKNWAIWGVKGHLSTHFNFEMGAALAMLVFPIRPVFDEAELVRARQLGPVAYFKAEALDVANLHLYERFYHDGWTNEIAREVKNKIAPQAARAIGMIWLLALLEAGQVVVLRGEQSVAQSLAKSITEQPAA